MDRTKSKRSCLVVPSDQLETLKGQRQESWCHCKSNEGGTLFSKLSREVALRWGLNSLAPNDQERLVQAALPRTRRDLAMSHLRTLGLAELS
jgi:hypothetical protein